jgi:CRP/FNR family transcriptional regulator, anaerobic regulatory protein
MPLRRELTTVVDLETGARVLAPGAYLYRQGEACSSCFVVLSGWIALSTLLDDGSCQMLDFALPGAVLGLQSMAAGPMYHSAQCLSIVRTYAFPRRSFETMIEANARLAVALCCQITADKARAHDHLTNLGLRGARERIAHLLLELYVRLYARLPSTAGEVISLPLSQEQIGNALGLTFVHVSRMLRGLREEKIVRLANHRLEIIEPRALIVAAGVCPDGLDEKMKASARVATAPHISATGLLPAGWMSVAEPSPLRRRFVAAQAA